MSTLAVSPLITSVFICRAMVLLELISFSHSKEEKRRRGEEEKRRRGEEEKRRRGEEEKREEGGGKEAGSIPIF